MILRNGCRTWILVRDHQYRSGCQRNPASSQSINCLVWGKRKMDNAHDCAWYLFTYVRRRISIKWSRSQSDYRALEGLAGLLHTENKLEFQVRLQSFRSLKPRSYHSLRSPWRFERKPPCCLIFFTRTVSHYRQWRVVIIKVCARLVFYAQNKTNNTFKSHRLDTQKYSVALYSTKGRARSGMWM